MAIWDILKGNSIIIGFLLVIGYLIYKYLIKPAANEGQPIEPREDDEQQDNFLEGLPKSL